MTFTPGLFPEPPTQAGDGSPGRREGKGAEARGARAGEEGAKDPGRGGARAHRRTGLTWIRDWARGRAGRRVGGPAPAQAPRPPVQPPHQPPHRDQQHRGAQQLPGQRRPLGCRQPRPQHRRRSPCRRRRRCPGPPARGPRVPGCPRHCLTVLRPGAAGAGPGLHARDRALASAPGGPTEERGRSPCRRGAGEDAVRQWRGQPARGGPRAGGRPPGAGPAVPEARGGVPGGGIVLGGPRGAAVRSARMPRWGFSPQAGRARVPVAAGPQMNRSGFPGNDQLCVALDGNAAASAGQSDQDPTGERRVCYSHGHTFKQQRF